MDAEILCEVRGAAGWVTLNRPKALNALNAGMVRALADALDAWADDPAITRVVVEGAGGRAFCAGGDIRAAWEAGRAGRPDDAMAFFRDEYRLNVRIKRFPKPYVSLVDGIVMGGGVGLSLHGSHLVAGDGFLFAMPEVAIGFFPDVGATWALPRLADRVGCYLALTGARLGPDDGVRLGLATHRVPSDGFAVLREALAVGADVDGLLAGAARPPGSGPVHAERALVASAFGAESVAAILSRLDAAAAAGSAFAGETASGMRLKSPTSQSIALRQMRLGPDLSFEQAMAIELRIVSRVLRGHDFYEGVRATLIDRDNRPVWSPSTLSGVSEAEIDAYLAPDDGSAPDRGA